MYKVLDNAIYGYISNNYHGPRFGEIESASDVCDEANRIAELTGRESFRVIDGRLQALRKKGLICSLSGKWFSIK